MCFYVWVVFVCTCICVWEMLRHVCTCVRRPEIKTSCLSLQFFTLFLLNLELTDWLGWQISKLHIRVLPHSPFMWVLGIWSWVFVIVWHTFYILGHDPSIWNFQFIKFGALLIMGKQYHRKQNQREPGTTIPQKNRQKIQSQGREGLFRQHWYLTCMGRQVVSSPPNSQVHCSFRAISQSGSSQTPLAFRLHNPRVTVTLKPFDWKCTHPLQRMSFCPWSVLSVQSELMDKTGRAETGSVQAAQLCRGRVCSEFCLCFKKTG